MQTNHHHPRIETNHPVTLAGSPLARAAAAGLAGDLSSAIASKLPSYNCIVPD
jgi:hypothetical protein